MGQLAGPVSGRGAETVYYLVAVAVGAITGVLGTALHLGADRILQWPSLLGSHFGLSGWTLILAASVISAVMVLLSVWLVRTFAPEAGGSGVQEIEGAMAGLRTVRWKRVLPVKFFGGFLSLGAGLVIGREGPTIHIGASVAQGWANRLRLPTTESHGLLAAGGAAGLAAAFGAPLASILFVIEETRRQFPYSLKTYTALMLACVTSGIVTEALAGRRPFMLVSVPDIPLEWMPAFVVLGALLAVLGVGFNRALVWSLDFTLRLGKRTNFYLFPAIVGLVVGGLLIVLPEATKGGEELAVNLISDNATLLVIALVVLVRFVMSMASYATGVPGGIFAPILSLATAFGLLFGMVIALVLPVPPGMEAAFAVAAMGGLFSATVRAPLVGIVLVAELTGAYSVLVPSILTCLFANLFADWLGGKPIYETLLERTLKLAGRKLPPEIDETSDGSEKLGGWDQR